MTITDVTSAVLEHVRRADPEPVFFAGAGVSMCAGLLDWKSLLTSPAKAVRVRSPLFGKTIAKNISHEYLTKAADLFALMDESPVGAANLHSS